MDPQYHRQVAHKLVIKEILESPYTRVEGWQQSYLEVGTKKISRINLIGIIIEQTANQLLLEDGTGRLAVEAYSPHLEVGTPVLIIGRVREADQRILFSEVIKPLSSLEWLHVRRLEYQKRKGTPVERRKEIPMKSTNLPQEIYALIKEQDSGEGVDIQKVTEKYPQGDKIVQNLIAEGEVFEIRPGRLKVLE